MRQRIAQWLAAGAGVAISASAFAYPGPGNQVIDSVAPVIAATGQEFIGPRSRIQIMIPANGILTDVGNPVTEIRLVGLDAAGNEVPGAVYAVPAGEVQGGFPNVGAGGAIALIQLNLDTSANDDFLYFLPNIASIGVTVADALSAAGDAGRVATRFNPAAEMGVGGDTCFTPDATPPRLVSGFLSGGNFSAVFNKPLSLAGGVGTNVAANETNVAAVVDADFQYIASPGPFNFVDATPQMNMAPNTGSFGAGAFLAGNTVIQFPLAVTGNFAINGQIRPTATGGGITAMNNITDFLGNRAVQASPTAGVTVTAPPAFAITNVRFLNESANFGGNDLRVTYSLPLNPADLGDFGFAGSFYGQFLMKADGTASDIAIGAVAIDPANNNAVLITLVANPGGDVVHSDALDPAGAGYRLDTNLAGNVPSSVFAANDYTTAQMVPLADGIPATRLGQGFHDLNGDGKIDAMSFLYDEPVSTTANTSNFILRKTNDTVQPFGLIAADGTLTNAMVVADADPNLNVITATGLMVSGGPMPPLGLTTKPLTYPGRLLQSNWVVITINPDTVNWDNNPATPVGSAMEAIPGTGGGLLGAGFTVESAAGFTVTDNGGNNTVSGPLPATQITVDLAPPVARFGFFLDGNNMIPGSNIQFINQQSAGLGANPANNRLVIIGSENFGALNSGNVEESRVLFGTGGVNGFQDDPASGSFGGVANNSLSLINTAPSPEFVPGVPFSVGSGSGIVDAAGNEMTVSDTMTIDRSAPYIANIADVNGVGTTAAFLFDTNNNNFVDQIRLNLTQPIDPATVQVTDFTLSLGTITGASVQGNDIVLSVADSVIPITSTVTITYNSNTDTTRIASLASAGGTGQAVSQTVPNAGLGQNVFTATRIAAPALATQELAFMDFVGTITTDGTTPCPPGTKIYAMIAAPHVYSVTATHNNVAFTVNAQTSVASINAWNAWLFGIREDVYLGRDTTNFQFYDNDKNLGASDNAVSTFRDVIRLNINAGSLTNLSFTGTGETNADRVTAGRVRFCWDVLRANSGLVQNFYSTAAGQGPRWGGQPILSSAVVTGTDGRYRLHVSAPIAAFNGLNRLSSVDRPVILIVEKPDGTRFAVSSVLTSVNGAPVRFRVQNRTQSAGQGVDATTFNINLAHVGAVGIHQGWNLVGFNRNSGFATSAAARPVRVDGVSESAIVIPTSSSPALPFTTPLNQFVFWNDTTVDLNLNGFASTDRVVRWTRTENANFSNIIIDPNCFPHFAFTMTSAGVQFGSGINNLVGGYALALFLPTPVGGAPTNLGAFQFGPMLTGNTLFAGTSTNSFPNNATTQGWGLFTSKAAFNPASGMRANGNPKLDYLFVFRNNGPLQAILGLEQATESFSLDLLAPAGSDNPNDAKRLDAGQPFFGHWQP